MVKNTLLLLLFKFSFSGCFDTRNLPAPTPNQSEKLRLDGFYYQISEIGGRIIASIYFLYENGVIRSKGSIEYSSVEELKVRMYDLNLADKKFVFKDGKYAYDYWGIWGIYEIRNDSISIIQQFLGGGKRIGEKKGKLINNSHFYAATNTPRKDKVDLYEFADHFYFVPTTSKPDSTNNFFK
jgi:hypothetical protein